MISHTAGSELGFVFADLQECTSMHWVRSENCEVSSLPFSDRVARKGREQNDGCRISDVIAGAERFANLRLVIGVGCGVVDMYRRALNSLLSLRDMMGGDSG